MKTSWAGGEPDKVYKAGYSQGQKNSTRGPNKPLPLDEQQLMQILENAGIAETAAQGPAPGAQLKGKNVIKSKGVKGYNDAHPASGRLVGDSVGSDLGEGGMPSSVINSKVR